MEIDGLKYIFVPIIICNKNRLCIRKRLLHKGYSILRMNIDFNNTCYRDTTYEHIVYVDTLFQAEIYLKNEYNINIKL
ncbi:MAG: hypothetical protein AB7G52_10410 [Arcobacter sp.]